ncbi:MAG: ABC transporter substrate-binding protein [Candidatus Hydrogenedentes bacterium]|nr:ABC transporter substrate-binding protein [Candidatus Hydrogenedentota bacterium]
MRRIGLAVLVLLMAGGCGQQQPAGGGNVTQAPGPKTGKLRVAVVPKALSHQFWMTVKAGADAAGKEFGVEIDWQGPAKETEVYKLISIMEDMISSKVNAIVMAACDENALIGVVQKAIDAGIPVVTIDSGIKSDIGVSFVATDNIAGGKAAARELARLVGNEGEVGLIPFVPGAATSEMREQGFLDGLAEFPNMKLAQKLYSMSDVAKSMSVTEDMMTSNPNLKGIFAASEPTAVGSAQALKAAGKAGQIKLVAFDASDEEIQALKAGTIQALIVQNPYQMGYRGVKAALDHLQGKPVEKRVDTGVTVVTMENFNNPDIQKLLYPLN